MLLRLLIILTLSIKGFSQDSVTKYLYPADVTLITEDINRFWLAFDSSKQDTNKASQIFSDIYFSNGTCGLTEFNKIGIKGVDNLVNAVTKYRSYYESIRTNTLVVSQMEKEIRSNFNKFKNIYPKAVFVDVFFLIGNLSSGGKQSKKGLLIGTEIFAADDDTNFGKIDSSFAVLLKSFSISSLPLIVMHELIHYQQKYIDTDRDLLGYSITEGSADFLTELVTGKKINKVLYEYGDTHEKELWQEFTKDKNSYNVNDWMYSPGKEGRPADVGYYIGYKIAQSYYSHMKDKAKAIEKILNIEDFNQFLKASKYTEKFIN